MSYTIVGYVVTFKLEDGSKLALLEYTSQTPEQVAIKVRVQALREGFNGSAIQRMLELGWTTEPIYLEDGGRERRAQPRG